MTLNFITTEQLSRNTIKFAAFSDRLVKLYPKEQVVALEGKNFAESYEDYLLSKASQKK
jgi:hypothetical protein